MKQHSFSSQKPINFQDVNNDIKSLHLQFTTPTDDEYEAIKFLTSTPLFCYAAFKKDPTNTLHPLGEGRFNFIAQRKVNLPVVVDGKKYFDEVGCEMIEGRSYLIIDDFFRIPFAETSEELGKQNYSNISFNFKTLSQRINCFEFLLAAERIGEFSVGNRIIKINKIEHNDVIQSTLDADKKLQSVIDQLNVKDDLNIQNCSVQDEKNANTLIDYYLLGKRVTSSIKSDHNFVRIDINNIKLQFLAEKIEEPDSYKLTSIHDLSDFVFTTMNDMGYHVQIPAFCMFNTQTFHEVCNISYNTFLEDCQRTMSYDNRFYQSINWSVLRMLQAYDLQEKKKQVLIETALSLDRWLMENDPDENTWLVHKINEIQIMKRMHELSETEKDFLFETIETDNSNEEVKFACYTLLDNKEFAERCFNKLPNETQSFVKELPIFNLFSALS